MQSTPTRIKNKILNPKPTSAVSLGNSAIDELSLATGMMCNDIYKRWYP